MPAPYASSPSLNILTEDVIAISEVPQELPGQARPHISAVYRWANVGVRGVRLEACRVGSQIVTSRQALTRFLNAIQAK